MTEPRPDLQILAEWAVLIALNFGVWALILFLIEGMLASPPGF